MQPRPVTLAGDLVVLEPLTPGHVADLTHAVRDGELWRLWYTLTPSPEQMPGHVAQRLAQRDAGLLVPFTIRRASDGRIVGATNYTNIDATVPRLEIGGTWLAASAQRSGINTEAKLLLLAHAFEELGCVRVELKTHSLNFQSRAAIERIGAQFEGLLRQHLRLPNGLVRDTAMYSIVAHEWPMVRTHLRRLLDSRGGPARSYGTVGS